MNALQRLRRLADAPAARPLRFIAVGGAATAVHLSIALLIVLGTPGVSVYLANLVAFLAAFGVSYWGHRHFTFQRSGSAWRFFLVAIAGLAANNLILTVGMRLGLERPTALVVAVILVPVLSYFVSSIWAFSEKTGEHRPH